MVVVVTIKSFQIRRDVETGGAINDTFKVVNRVLSWQLSCPKGIGEGADTNSWLEMKAPAPHLSHLPITRSATFASQ